MTLWFDRLYEHIYTHRVKRRILDPAKVKMERLHPLSFYFIILKPSSMTLLKDETEGVTE